jgi:hypothetical protein
MSASASELSRHLDVSREQVRRLVAQGLIERLPDGRFDLDRCRQSYIRHLRAQTHSGSEPLTAARIKLIELRTAKMRAGLMNMPAALAFLTDMMSELFVMLIAMVAHESRNRDERRRWTAAINGVRNKWADLMDARRQQLEDEMRKDDAA